MYRGKLANAVRAIGGAAKLSSLPCDASELQRALLVAEDGDDPGQEKGTPITRPPGISQCLSLAVCHISFTTSRASKFRIVKHISYCVFT